MKQSTFPVVAAFILVTQGGCGWFSHKSPNEPLTRDVSGLELNPDSGKTEIPDFQLPAVPPGARRMDITPDSHIPVAYSRSGRAFIPVEGLLSESGYAKLHANAALLKLNSAEKTQQSEKLLRNIAAKLSERAAFRSTFFAPEIGYFSGWIAVSDYPRLRDVQGLDTGVFMAPRAQANARPHATRRSSARKEAATNPTGAGAHFSGIERMGVGQFLGMVEKDVGQKPTGERVKVGVTDTGVTFAHPAFRSSRTSRQRISYMKDFTNEGAGFVSERASLVVRRTESASSKAKENGLSVQVDADLLMPDALAGGVLPVDEDGKAKLPFKSIVNENFLLPETLVETLESPNHGVRMGVLSESAFSSDDEKVDINANGKTDDEFYFFVLPADAKGHEKVLVDFSGSRDFRKSKAVKDFNLSGNTMDVVSERIGLSLTTIEIPIELPVDESTVPAEKLTRIAIVGYDPGNHGSHVSGIIGAQKTISNDNNDTQARGVAPEVDLMVNRVCANNSGCNATRAIIDLARNGARIVNMSLGGLSALNDGYGVQETVINRLTELYDVLFVISAGNSGPGRQTVGSPSTARLALSVAATASPAMIAKQYNWPQPASAGTNDNDEDFVMFFSSRGPTSAGGFKPNIAAPGTQLSTIQLNSAAGSRSGLDVYWGTSMAAPAATGAIALLLDAAHIYNQRNPTRPLPTDALTLRRVIMDSARPFRANFFNPATGASGKGVYTWIDQGYGMVSLPRAWELLKQKAASDIHSGVVLAAGDTTGREKSVTLDYKIRVLRALGNGLKYDGSQSFDTGSLVGSAQTERKFGQGIWLTEEEVENLVEVHFNRSLMSKDLARTQVGDLLRQLNTSAENFTLETVYYGSRSQWLKVGVPQSVACASDDVSASSSLTIVGAGAIDLPVDPDNKTGLNPSRASSLYLCLNKKMIQELPPGDHGAIIRAYRTEGGKRDVLAAFEIPVYLTIPHHAAAMNAKFNVSQDVGSFMVDRHYLRVPKGVSVLRVSLEVPKADAADQGSSCSGVSLMVLAGGNTRTPADLVSSGSVAQSCTSLGAPINNRLSVKFTEMKPLPGIWDLHVFGRYQFPKSNYALNIDYATFADIPPLKLKPETLGQGEFDVVLKESTFDAAPYADKSSFTLDALESRTQHEISRNQGVIVVPAANGRRARTYGADAGVVSIRTTSSMENLDIDMVIDECDDEQLVVCKAVARSGSATADEFGQFTPQSGKFYAVRIDPYSVPAELAGFVMTERISAREPETGSLQISSVASAEGAFKVGYAFQGQNSGLLTNPLFQSGPYEIVGEIKLSNLAGIALTNVPVSVGR